jgi:hypothetical protein
MPLIGLLHIFIAVSLGIHAMKTGRPQYWLMILLMVPLVGSIAYVCFELIPELGQTRRAREVKRGFADLVSPDREFHRLSRDVTARDSVDAKQALALECERKSMWSDAIALYHAAAQGQYANDPALLTGLARALLNNGSAQTALTTMEKLREAHPDLDHQDAHLVYARCLENLGRIEDAKDEYENLAGYYIGLEARTRYALLLMKTGAPEKAKVLFESVAKAGSARGVVLSEIDRDWLRVAKANI